MFTRRIYVLLVAVLRIFDAIGEEHCVSGKCFEFVDTRLSFIDANIHCKTLNKTLLRIDLPTDQKSLLIELQKVVDRNTSVWFGLYSTGGRYRWISGSPAVHNVFFGANVTGEDGCASIQTGSGLTTWKLQNCETKLFFLCGTDVEPSLPKAIVGGGFQCPDNYHIVGTKCFLPKLNEQDVLTWKEATTFCSKSANSGTLATISSLLDQDYISLMISRTIGPAWIGLHLENSSHQWANTSERLLFTNWSPYMPTFSTQSRCTVVHQRSRHLGQWEDMDCNSHLGFFCQAPAQKIEDGESSPDPPFLYSQGKCRLGFWEYHNRCYQLMPPDTSLPNGTNYLAPHSSEELALMRLFLNLPQAGSIQYNYSWIGVHFIFDSVNFTIFKFEVVDGLPITLAANMDWYQFPTTTPIKLGVNVNRYCIALSRFDTSLVWSNCTNKLPMMVGYALDGYELESTINDTDCPAYWSRLGDKCYSEVFRTPRTWMEAERACNQLHSGRSHLVSLHSPAEQDFVSVLLSHNRAWLGMRVKLRMNGKRSISYTWSDDSSLDYLSFAMDQPSFSFNDGAMEECVIVESHTQDWNDVSCWDRHAYICQLNLVESPSSSTIQSVKHTVPDSPKEYCLVGPPRLCFELRRKPLPFWDAEQECRLRNKTLITIPNQQSHEFLLENITSLFDHPHIQAFIGLFAPTGRWRWVSGYPAVSDTFWAPRHPAGRNQCAYIDTSLSELNTWKSGPCDQPLPYLCGSVLQVSETPAVPNNYNCPNDFVHVGNSKCFFVYNDVSDLGVTWSRASEICAKMSSGARLASVNSLIEQDILTALLGPQPKSVWIGLHLDKTGAHAWQNEDPIVYTYWGDGQPSGSGERCTAMQSQFDRLGDWIDLDCNEHLGYMCQADPVPDREGETIRDTSRNLLVQGRCMPGYYEYRDQCFAVSIASQRLERDAHQLHDTVTGKCIEMVHSAGADCESEKTPWGTVMCPIPATPHTHADAAFIRLLVTAFGHNRREAWVGLKLKMGKAGNNSAKHLNELHLVSEDRSVLGASTMIEFSSEYLLLPNGNQEIKQTYICLTVSRADTELKLTNCSTTGLPVVCSYFLDSHPFHPTKHFDTAVNCPPNWSTLGDKCYQPSGSEVRQTWWEAEETCRLTAQRISPQEDGKALIGHLASVHTLEEEHWLHDLAPTESIWTGMRLIYSPHGPPSKRALSEQPFHLVWSDNSPVDYLSVDYKSRTPLVDAQSCLELVGKQSKWRLTECYQPRGFVCQLSVVDKPASSEPHSVSCDNSYPLRSASDTKCYRLFQANYDWPTAEGVCRNLHPTGNLATFHSKTELDELVRIIQDNAHSALDVWSGLYESDFSYTWSDGSPLNFIPLSADLAKDDRHLVQDCFIFSYKNISDSNPSVKLKAVDCHSPHGAFICQRTSDTSLPRVPMLESQQVETTIDCPPKFRQYADRCFLVIPEQMTWSNAERSCRESAGAHSDFIGSLARIDNADEQEFVSSLLDNLLSTQSSAWIGLQRNLSEENPNFHWVESRTPVTYLRPVYRVHKEPLFDHKAIKSISVGASINMTLCTSAYRSTYPRLNGLWLQWDCDVPTILPAICQAVRQSLTSKSSKVQMSEKKEQPTGCPEGFILGTTGQSVKSKQINLSQPMCYRMLDTIHRRDWNASSEGCRALSTPNHTVSLLTVASVFEASFLRSWLNNPNVFSSSILPRNEAVWAGLNLPETSPENPSVNWSWTWNVSTADPVRYTDWLNPPPSVTGCYTFKLNPYRKNHSVVDVGLGSLAPAESCDMLHFSVCQTLSKSESAEQTVITPKPANEDNLSIEFIHQPIRPNCSIYEPVVNSPVMIVNLQRSTSGKACMRWDMLPANLTNFRFTSNRLRHNLHASKQVGGSGNPSYAENYCSVMYDSMTGALQHGCYVELNPPRFEECQLLRCIPISGGESSRIITGRTLFAILILIFILTIVFLLIAWRVRSPLRDGYRRYFNSSRSTTHGRNSSIIFSPPDKVSHLMLRTPQRNVAYSEMKQPLTLNSNEVGYVYPPMVSSNNTTTPTFLSSASTDPISGPDHSHEPPMRLHNPLFASKHKESIEPDFDQEPSV